MDNLIPMLLAFPPDAANVHIFADRELDGDIQEHVKLLRKIPKKALVQSITSQERSLELLGASVNTASYFVALAAFLATLPQSRRQTSLSDEERYGLQKALILLRQGDPRQIRYVGHEFRSVMDYVLSLTLHELYGEECLNAVATAMCRIDSTGNTFTSFHMPVLQSALQTGFYKAVEGLLAQDILHFPGAGVMLPPSQYICTSTTPAYSYITIESGLTGKVSATDFLKYLVYSATINIGLGRWKRAVDILEVAVEYPTKENGLSRIMVEAYKKWFLLRAVIEGKVPNIPTTVGAQQQKVFRHLALPYEVLATLFCSGSLARLRSEVNVGRELWHADGNSGLVQMLVAKYSQQHVKRLSTVYKTISVHNIGSQNHTGDAARQEEQDEEATSLVRSLIACDEVRACIKEDDAGIQYVVFGEEDVLLKEELVQERLSDATSRLEMLVRDVKEINREFQLDKEYLKWMLKQKAAGDFIDLESAGQELKWGAGPDDEDLMAQ